MLLIPLLLACNEAFVNQPQEWNPTHYAKVANDPLPPQSTKGRVMQTAGKKHFAHSGLVVAPSATSVLRFATDPLPALSCVASWNNDMTLGWSQIPGVLDGFVTEVVNGRTLVKFNMSIYNSSLTENFVITDRSGIDSHGDVADFWQAELLDANGTHLQYAGGKQYVRFVCYEARPMQCGFAPSQEYLTIAPQWADTYPANMDDQWFDMTDLPTGAYSIQFTVDPLQKYGEFQIANYNLVWNGTGFDARGN